MTLTVRVPEELSARVPVEQRGPGLARDSVRLLVSRGTRVAHHAFRDLPALLRPGDLLVVNTSPTLPAAVDGSIGHARVVVHFSTRGEDGRWAVELREPDGNGTTRPRAGGPAGAVVRLPGGLRLVLEEPLGAGSGRLWWARARTGGERGGAFGASSPGRAGEVDRSGRAGGDDRSGRAGGDGRSGRPARPSEPPQESLPPGAGPPGRPCGPSSGPGSGPSSGPGEAYPMPGAGAPGAGRLPGPGRTNGPGQSDEPEQADRPGQTDGPKQTDRPGRLAGSAPSSPHGADPVVRMLRGHGRAIRYSYTERDQALAAYQTVFALDTPDGAGSAEMPSAARPFTGRVVAELVSRGVQFAPVTLHTGVASGEAHEAPYAERFAVPEVSARVINAVRAGDGRVIAVGTTAVRAVESAVGADGVVRACAGWTDLVVTPERGVRVVDGLLTGLHEPEASHLLMLEAVAGRAAVSRGYEEAVRGRYLWHEFGDLHLLLPADNPHTAHCSSN